jgi:hypothetical protein
MYILLSVSFYFLVSVVAGNAPFGEKAQNHVYSFAAPPF